mgnify:CR=1 FL=1
MTIITTTQTTIDLQDGEAHLMGDGTFVLTQRCEQDQPQSVVLQEDDLRRLLGTGRTEGIAHSRLNELEETAQVIPFPRSAPNAPSGPDVFVRTEVTYLGDGTVGLDQGMGVVVLDVETLLDVLCPLLHDDTQSPPEGL